MEQETGIACLPGNEPKTSENTRKGFPQWSRIHWRPRPNSMGCGAWTLWPMYYRMEENRVFNVMDDCNREALVMDVALNYPAKRVVQTLGHLEEVIGLPKTIRCDNGPEFISNDLNEWCKKKRIELILQPGKYAERIYGTAQQVLQGGLSDAFWFNDLHQIRTLIINILKPSIRTRH